MSYKYKKIMIIDDSEVDTYIASILIKNNNFAKEIITFNNGLKAFDFLKENLPNQDLLPDLILLDLYMPILNGFEFVEMIKKIDFNADKKCKICIVSSSIDDNDIIKSKLDSSIFTFISKPINARLLLAL